jgi:hypothetical protein
MKAQLAWNASKQPSIVGKMAGRDWFRLDKNDQSMT